MNVHDITLPYITNITINLITAQYKHYINLHYIVLHLLNCLIYIALHYNTLHYITLHYSGENPRLSPALLKHLMEALKVAIVLVTITCHGASH